MELMTRHMLGEHLEEKEYATVRSLGAIHQEIYAETVAKLRAMSPQTESSESVKCPNPESACRLGVEQSPQHWESTLQVSIRPAVRQEYKTASRLDKCSRKMKALAYRLLRALILDSAYAMTPNSMVGTKSLVSRQSLSL
jgi:hypothetical protein